MPKTVGIILIGNEILSGKIAHANATYLCREPARSARTCADHRDSR
jgi:molybdopterin-biosynthesis enzyme MoeA-like protein